MNHFVNRLPAIGLGLVFLIFGLWQIVDPLYWIAYLPAMVTDQIDGLLFFRGVGVFNTIVGAALIAGVAPMFFAALAALHLLGVIISLGVTNDIAVRDLGLFVVALGVFLQSRKQ